MARTVYYQGRLYRAYARYDSYRQAKQFAMKQKKKYRRRGITLHWMIQADDGRMLAPWNKTYTLFFDRLWRRGL